MNNCLGLGNYKYFLGLLLSTSILLVWGSYLAYTVLAPAVHWHFDKYPEWHSGTLTARTDPLGRVLGFLPWLADVITTGFDVGGLSLGGVGLLATLTAPLPAGLLAYHIYLIWAGMTTNESAKWTDWKEDIEDGMVFAARIKDSEVYGDLDENGYIVEQRHDSIDVASKHSKAEYVWPVRSRQMLVRTSDRQAPRAVPPHLAELIVPDSWVQVLSLVDVENIYDQGFWKNLVEVLRY